VAAIYPLPLPSSPKPSGVSIRPRSVVATSVSPFTLQTQTYSWRGQIWEAEIELPPMQRDDAERWISALTALNGAEGSFLLGDPSGLVPQGIATGAPTVSGASQVGYDLVTAGWTTLTNGIIRAGDWVQLGSTNLFLNSTQTSGTDSGSLANNAATDPFGAANNAARVTGYTNPSLSIYKDQAHIPAPAIASVYIKPSVSVTATIQARSAFNPSGVASANFSAPSGVWTRLSVAIPQTAASVNRTSVLLSAACNCDIGAWQMSPSAALGDYVATTSAPVSTNRLHKVVMAASSDGSGASTLTLWPRLRSSPVNGSSVVINSPRGKFRLTGPVEWSVTNASLFGLSFQAVEDLRP